MGQGKPGENGGKPGDLLIKIIIENDPKYKLQGVDLYTNLYLTPWEAALGTKVNLFSIEGMQSGETLKINGKGYYNGKGGRGDLIAQIQIMVPKVMSKEEKELFTELQKVSKYNPRKVELT